MRVQAMMRSYRQSRPENQIFHCFDVIVRASAGQLPSEALFLYQHPSQQLRLLIQLMSPSHSSYRDDSLLPKTTYQYLHSPSSSHSHDSIIAAPITALGLITLHKLSFIPSINSIRQSVKYASRSTVFQGEHVL